MFLRDSSLRLLNSCDDDRGSLMIRMVTDQYDNHGADDAEAGDAEDHVGEVGNNHATG